MEYLLEVDADLSLWFYQKKPGGIIRTTLEEILGDKKPGRYTMEIKQIRQIRTLQQNKYYWGVIIPIIQEWMGEEDKDFVHEVLKSLFLEKTFKKNLLDKRKKIWKQISTTEIDTKEMTDYIEKIRFKFKDLNIPSPDSEDGLKAYDFYMGFS